MRCPTLTELPPPPPGKSGWPWTEETPADAFCITEGKTYPLVSIITPSYNQSQFLEETIRSVLLQGYPELEYWIIDGESQDRSVEIIKRYEQWLTGWISEKDNGQTEAINKGLTHSKGSIIAYLNSDDIYQPYAFSRIISIFNHCHDVDIVYGSYEITDDERRIRYKNEASEFDIEQLLMRDFICQPTAFWRNTVHDRIGFFNDDLQYVMDYDFFLRAATIGKCRFAKIDGDSIAGIKLWQGAKTSNKSETCLKEELDILKYLFALPQLPINLKKMRNRAIAQTYLDFAYSKYLSFDMRMARRCLFQALTIYSKLVYQPSYWSLYFKTILGARLSSFARQTLWIFRKYRHKKKYVQI